MRRRKQALIWVMMVLMMVSAWAPAAGARSQPVDLADRLNEIYQLRARWLLTGETPPPFAADFVPGLGRAKWALHHEDGKVRYMKLWAKNRGVRFVEANPSLYIKYLGGDEQRARFYVGQTLQLGYTYPGETAVNRFGVGTRHVLELRLHGGKWLIGSEWYTDPLGDDTETPDVTPALVPEPPGRAIPVLSPGPGPAPPADVAAPRRVYDRARAVSYADQFCGLAWGCGNDHRYNRRYRDYNGVGGDCTNFTSQVLRAGGLKVPMIIRVSNLAGHLQGTGRARLTARGPFQDLWQRAAREPQGFRSLVGVADLMAYQEKGKLEHFAIITGFDSRGYPLVNSHTADRYRVPFDLGWDRKTVYWFFRING